MDHRSDSIILSQKSSAPMSSRLEQDSQTTQHRRPPAEAVHLARMLSDLTPADLQERIAQVQIVVNCSHDEVSVALHDNDYSTERAAAALLDEIETGEWTTTSRKGKKKVESEPPLPSPAQQPAEAGGEKRRRRERERGKPSAVPRRAVRQAPRRAVESFGEAAVVIEHSGRSPAGRGKPRGRSDRGRGSRERGRGRRGNPNYRGGKATEDWSLPESEKQGIPPLSISRQPKQDWGSGEGNPAISSPVLPPENQEPALLSPTAALSVVGPGSDQLSAWEEVRLTALASSEQQQQKSTSTQEAFHSRSPAPSRPRVQFSGVEDSRPSEKKLRLKSRKAAKAKIPLDAVEMPSNTVEEIELQFGNLGIGFGDSPAELEQPMLTLDQLEDFPVVSEGEMVTTVTEQQPMMSPSSPSAKKDDQQLPASLVGSPFRPAESPSSLLKIDPPPGLSRHQGLPLPPSMPQPRGFAASSSSSTQHSTPVTAQPITAPPPPHITAPPTRLTAPPPLITAPAPLITAPPPHITAPPTQMSTKLQESISKTVTGSNVQLSSLPPVVHSKAALSAAQATKPNMPLANQPLPVYPYPPPYMMAPMQYHYDNMYYHHVTSADYNSLSRDPLVSFGDSKAVGSPSTVAQQQGGMQQGQPHPVPIHYPYYGMYMPGMQYSQQMGPKPASGGGFGSASGTAFPPTTTAFGSYDDDYRFATTTTVKSGVSDGFKHQYDGSKASSGGGGGGGAGAGFGYNMAMGGAGGGGYGYMHMPYHQPPTMVPLPQEGGGGGVAGGSGRPQPKHSRNYTGNTWGPATHTT